AEDPSLRLRFRRFKEDWQYFKEKKLPIVRFESFLENPEIVLRNTCEQSQLMWDPGMLTWPKPVNEIADASHGSRTFKINRNQGLNISAPSPKSVPGNQNILQGD